MLSKRSIFLGILFLLPVLAYLSVGAYALWETGLFRWTWWIIPGCWVLTFGIARLWKPQPLPVTPEPLPVHWTPQDEAAMSIVTRFQNEVAALSPKQLTDIHFYVQQSQELAKALSQHYHPNSKELYSSVTVVEVLAAIRLAVEDLEEWFQESVPGSHLLTIDHWKMLGKAPKWIKRASDASWVASMVVNPLNIARFLGSKLTFEPIVAELRAEILATVYLRFIRHIGFYLVEMNSGRLRRGAKRYRSAFGSGPVHSSKDPSVELSKQPTDSIAITPESVVVAIVGQVKAGKSSLINALIGERQTVTDVLPETKKVTRHRIQIPGSPDTVTLLDTPGYHDAGATKSDLDELQRAIEEADVVLLVNAANSPGKEADLDLLRQLARHYKGLPDLKPPPILLALTHIDLLSPMLEWKPPYDWKTPQTLKETSIHHAVAYVHQLLTELSLKPDQIIPVCTDVDRNRVYNISEELIPALALHLPAGKTAGLLKAYEKSLDSDKFAALLQQFKSSGRTLFNTWLDERFDKKP